MRATISTLLFILVANVSSLAQKVELSFGLYQTDKATVMYKKFRPFLQHLEKARSQR